MPTGHPDDARRKRITSGVLAVLQERGVEGLTHRAVAAAAGVPLGSTTYHFRSKDDLLAVALSEAIDGWATELDAWAAALPLGTPLAQALAEWHVQATTTRRATSLVELELFSAALRRPALQELASVWEDRMVAAMGTLVNDASLGRVVAAAATGITFATLARGTSLDPGDAEVWFRTLLGDLVVGQHRSHS